GERIGEHGTVDGTTLAGCLLSPRSRGTGAAAAPGYVEAQKRALEGRLRHRQVLLAAPLASVAETCFGALAGGLRPVDIDLFGRLSRVSQHGDMIVAHFHEAAFDREVLLLAPAPEDELAVVERGHERCVARQDRELAFGGGHYEGIDAL